MRLWHRAAPGARRVGLLAGAVLAVAAMAAVPAVARLHSETAVVTPCRPTNAGVTEKTARVVVYAEQTGVDAYSGGPLTTYFACLRPKGQPIAIGQSAASGGEYPGNVEMQDLKIAGTFLADESADGLASAAACGKYDPTYPCGSLVKYSIEIADVSARRKVKVAVAGPASSLAVSSTGAVAWVVSTAASSPSGSPSSILYAVVVHPAGRGSLSARPAVIDKGQTITSVSFCGSSVRWRNSGQPEQRTLS